MLGPPPTPKPMGVEFGVEKIWRNDGAAATWVQDYHDAYSIIFCYIILMNFP